MKQIFTRLPLILRRSMVRDICVAFSLILALGFLIEANAKKGGGGGGGGGKPPPGGGTGGIPVSIVIESLGGSSGLSDDASMPLQNTSTPAPYVTDGNVKTFAEINGGSGRLNADTNTSKKKGSGRTVGIFLPESVLWEVGIDGYGNDPTPVWYWPEQVEIETGASFDLRTIGEPGGLPNTAYVPLIVKTQGYGKGWSESFWLNYGGINDSEDQVCQNLGTPPEWDLVSVGRSVDGKTWTFSSTGPAVVHGVEWDKDGPCFGVHDIPFVMTVTDITP